MVDWNQPSQFTDPVSSFKCVVVVVAINSEVKIDSRVSMEIGCKDHLASWYIIYKCVNLEPSFYSIKARWYKKVLNNHLTTLKFWLSMYISNC